MGTPSSTCIGCAVGDGNLKVLFELAEKVNRPYGSMVDVLSAAVQGLCSVHLEHAIVLHTCMKEAFERRSKSSLRAVRDDEPEPTPTSDNPFTRRDPPNLLDHYRDLTPRSNPFEPRQLPLPAALQSQLKELLDAPITTQSLKELAETAILASRLLELQDKKTLRTLPMGVPVICEREGCCEPASVTLSDPPMCVCLKCHAASVVGGGAFL
jgi:hypothetical protein